jgi:N-hydroxyarylamine O-acetyltransferase
VDIRAYLDRINYRGPLEPTAETLRALHRRHMMSVPFENLDIGLGREIVLDPERFVEKIVTHRRGGFCYELNGAFAALLGALGFHVTLLSARVANDQGIASKEFDHLALQVDLEDRWLADVGFGDSFVEPLCLVTQVEQQDVT